MSRERVRWSMVALLAGAAVLSVVGKVLDQPLIGWLSFACFLGAVFAYVTWRRDVAARRRATVFDAEAKTPDETRTGPDE